MPAHLRPLAILLLGGALLTAPLVSTAPAGSCGDSAIAGDGVCVGIPACIAKRRAGCAKCRKRPGGKR